MTNTAVLNNEEVVNNEAAVNEKETMSVAEKIFAVRHFLPLVSTLGVIIFAASSNGTISGVGAALMCLGLLFAMTICPLKLIAFPLKCVGKGFKLFRSFIPVYGVADLTAAIFGTITGFVFGMAVILSVPAAFTIKKYLDKDEFEIED